MSLPLLLGIIATDKSHPEAGSGRAAICACRPVANNSPILGRPLALLASNSHAVSEGLLVVKFVPVVSSPNILDSPGPSCYYMAKAMCTLCCCSSLTSNRK